MFFQRFFKRKKNFHTKMHNYNDDDIDTNTAQKARQSAYSSPKHRAATQLTPVWEHILRTRTLPEHICPSTIYAEFQERLRDPEWQVRQHALRVLVDVLVVMRQAADVYMQPLIPQLVENLGHAAPTIRKGALDCLRVYLLETARPHKVLQQILNIGLNDAPTNDQFGGRLTCGVLLSVPALIQSILQNEQRDKILETTINLLLEKIQYVEQEEIILKVLWKLSELIGEDEFRQFMSAKTYRDLQLLTNIYSRHSHENRASHWQMERASDLLWRSTTDQKDHMKLAKIIMETDIKINDDTLTMRLLEADETLSSAAENSEDLRETEVIYGNMEKTNKIYRVTSYSDSELEEKQPITPLRTPKRVTFGGEVVKVRTPDSDASTVVTKSEPLKLSTSFSSISETSSSQPLSVDIPSDNTQPLETVMPQEERSSGSVSMSPRLSHKRLSISSVESNISPKTPHKEIEVLHNLQRDPSPSRVKRVDILSPTTVFGESYTPRTQNESTQTASHNKSQQIVQRTWEELNIVNEETLRELKSANWRDRLHGIQTLEDALRYTDTLARVQPYLESLLKTLLSSERHFEVVEAKHRLLVNLISRLPLDNLENRAVQIMTGLCRQGGPAANRLFKALMQRLPPATIVLKLTSPEFLHARSSRFIEHALQIVIYAMMTFPSSCFDTETFVTNVTYVLFSRKRRVRQAALELFAVLAQIVPPRFLFELVQQIADSRDDGAGLIAALKTRLARKKLPLLTSDNTVQYAPHNMDYEELQYKSQADIDWIQSGIGSVSPTALKRRERVFKYRSNSQQNFTGLPEQIDRNNYSDDIYTSNKNWRENLNTQLSKGQNEHFKNGYQKTSHINSIAKKSNGYCTNSRFLLKSCSDSSMDGRSSDSTIASSGETETGLNGEDDKRGRFTRLPVNSRFPAMDANSYMRAQNINISYQGNEGYTQFNPKQYNLQKRNFKYPTTNMMATTTQHNQRRAIQYPTDISHFHNNFHLQGTAVDNSSNFSDNMENNVKWSHNNNSNNNKNHNKQQQALEVNQRPPSVENAFAIEPKSQQQRQSNSSNGGRRFVNGEKLATMQGEEMSEGSLAETLDTVAKSNEESQTTNSTKSATYSQKSTASVLSATSIAEPKVEPTTATTEISTPVTTLITTMQENSTNDEVDATPQARLISSFEDEIKSEEEINNNTQRESYSIERNASLNSLHSKTESIKTQLENDATPILSRAPSSKSLMIEEDIDLVSEEEIQDLVNEEPARSTSPTIDQIKALSKSMESLFAQRHMHTEDSSSQSSHSVVPISVNPIVKTSPLKQKSKSLHFMRSKRRVSPAKQAIKVTQAELYPASLLHFEKPREAINQAFDHMDSSNWETIMLGLKAMVRLIRHHPEQLEHQMHMVCIQMTRSVRNLRSQVSRAACQAARELFSCHKLKYLENECDDLIAALLHRTADTNRFLRADAAQALEAMCDGLSPIKVLNILSSRGSTHQNALVRTTAAKLLDHLVTRLGSDKIYVLPRDSRDKFFVTGANLLLEGSLDTRRYAKSVFRQLSKHPHYNRLLLEVIPNRTYRNVEKTLKSIN